MQAAYSSQRAGVCTAVKLSSVYCCQVGRQACVQQDRPVLAVQLTKETACAAHAPGDAQCNCKVTRLWCCAWFAQIHRCTALRRTAPLRCKPVTSHRLTDASQIAHAVLRQAHLCRGLHFSNHNHQLAVESSTITLQHTGTLCTKLVLRQPHLCRGLSCAPLPHPPPPQQHREQQT
jgi:hypothetical protein